MIERIEAALHIVEIGLRRIGRPVEQAARAGRRGEVHRLDTAAGEGGDVTKGPGGAEQAAMPGVPIRQADALVVRIGRRRRAIGIVAGGDAARARPDRAFLPMKERVESMT